MSTDTEDTNMSSDMENAYILLEPQHPVLNGRMIRLPIYQFVKFVRSFHVLFPDEQRTKGTSTRDYDELISAKLLTENSQQASTETSCKMTQTQESSSFNSKNSQAEPKQSSRVAPFQRTNTTVTTSRHPQISVNHKERGYNPTTRILNIVAEHIMKLKYVRELGKENSETSQQEVTKKYDTAFENDFARKYINLVQLATQRNVRIPDDTVSDVDSERGHSYRNRSYSRSAGHDKQKKHEKSASNVTGRHSTEKSRFRSSTRTTENFSHKRSSKNRSLSPSPSRKRSRESSSSRERTSDVSRRYSSKHEKSSSHKKDSKSQGNTRQLIKSGSTSQRKLSTSDSQSFPDVKEHHEKIDNAGCSEITRLQVIPAQEDQSMTVNDGCETKPIGCYRSQTISDPRLAKSVQNRPQDTSSLVTKNELNKEVEITSSSQKHMNSDTVILGSNAKISLAQVKSGQLTVTSSLTEFDQAETITSTYGSDEFPFNAENASLNSEKVQVTSSPSSAISMETIDESYSPKDTSLSPTLQSDGDSKINNLSDSRRNIPDASPISHFGRSKPEGNVQHKSHSPTSVPEGSRTNSEFSSDIKQVDVQGSDVGKLQESQSSNKMRIEKLKDDDNKRHQQNTLSTNAPKSLSKKFDRKSSSVADSVQLAKTAKKEWEMDKSAEPREIASTSQTHYPKTSTLRNTIRETRGKWNHSRFSQRGANRNSGLGIQRRRRQQGFSKISTHVTPRRDSSGSSDLYYRNCEANRYHEQSFPRPPLPKFPTHRTYEYFAPTIRIPTPARNPRPRHPTRQFSRNGVAGHF